MDAGARVIHVDVMDGHFVPPITIGPLVAAAIADQVHDAGGAIDVHLMIERPEQQIDEFAKAGADSITIHAEADRARQPHPERDPRGRLPRRAGAQPRHAGGPRSPSSAGVADLVLCMTVNPGWGGQAFIASSPDKVAPARRARSPRRCSRSTAASTPTRPARSPTPGATPVRRRLGDLRRRRPGGGLPGDRRRGGGAVAVSRSVRALRAAAGRRGAERAGELLPPGALGRRDARAARRGARTSRRAGAGRRRRAASAPVAA